MKKLLLLLVLVSGCSPPTRVAKTIKSVQVLKVGILIVGSSQYDDWKTRIRFVGRGRIDLPLRQSDDWKPGDQVWLVDGYYLELYKGAE